MRLTETVSKTVNNITERLVRDAIVYGVCALCAVVILILVIQAAVLALEPLTSDVYARLIVAGVFALIAAGALLWLKFAHPRPRRTVATQKANARAEAAPQDAEYPYIAMLVEAAMLGYSMSRKSDRRPHNKAH